MTANILEKLGVACHPMLIGSLPPMDTQEALDLVIAHVPEIPNWVQMPGIAAEGMIAQFASGLPGLTRRGGTLRVDTTGAGFERDVLDFYEEYLAVLEQGIPVSRTRFALPQEAAGGFFAFLERVRRMPHKPAAVKGQITGPFTFGTALKDQSGRALFYDDQTRDMVVKLIAMKAAWQVQRLQSTGVPAILFVDEPSLAGFGSSEFISVSREDVRDSLAEVVEAVQGAGGVAGVHVCANTDWSVVMETGVEIVNFDAYAYFDRLILYAEQLVEFFKSGRWLAWGIVPTLRVEDIQKETAASLAEQLRAKMDRVASLGVEKSVVLKRSLITPSCGSGTLSLDFSKKVLSFTRNVSQILRKEVDEC